MKRGQVAGQGKEDVAQEILRYINEHLTEHLTLEGLAEKFYMSKNHLTAIFKRAAGTTVARYILYKRMTIARKELAGEEHLLQRQHLKPDLEIIPASSGRTGRCLAVRLQTNRQWNCRIWIRAGTFRKI